MHSGKLGHTGIFIRPPRPKSGFSGTAAGGPSAALAAASKKTSSGGDELEEREGSAAAAAAARNEEDNPGGAGGAGTGAAEEDGEAERATDKGGGKIRSEAEDAWSCCGKTLESAGRGCEPREPLATVSVPRHFVFAKLDEFTEARGSPMSTQPAPVPRPGRCACRNVSRPTARKSVPLPGRLTGVRRMKRATRTSALDGLH